MTQEVLPEKMYISYYSATKGKKVLKLLNKTQLIFISSNNKIIEPSKKEWESFWEKIEQIGIWDLEESYNRCILTDGYKWEINISFNNKIIESTGTNLDPTLYIGNKLISVLDKFLDAIYDLTEIQMD
ncbi:MULTISPECIES: hypothetical protein [Methanobrevibacter]|jgi:hypothetical protein|uniref:hypothetical protein n=1 Tax=Methanobrevibacter TaxID=2172 RepID=UPI0038FCDAA8